MQGFAWSFLMFLFKKFQSRKSVPKKFKRPDRGAAFWGLIGLFGVAVAGLAVFLYGWKIETKRYRLEKLSLKTGKGNGKGPTKALKVLHISDLHLCGHDQAKVDFIRGITDDDYDLIVLTGDVFEFDDGLKFGDKLLTRKPRLGAYAVFGNHDYYHYSIFNKTVGRVLKRYRHPPAKKDVTPHKKALEAGGFTVLVNETVHLSEPNVFIVGIDYPGIKEEKLNELMAQAPEGSLKLALFHLPRNLEQLERAGFQLAFGGHTHGGQVRMPGYGALITDSDLPRQEASGFVHRGDTVLHISRGLGADPRSNFRLFCPPAATEIELLY